MDKNDYEHKTRKIFITKKCPECLTHLPLETEICTSCKKKVGEVDKNGIAKRPTDWMAYIICFGSLLVLCLYLWWLFTKD